MAAGRSAPSRRAATHARSLPPLPGLADRGLSEGAGYGGGESGAGEVGEVAERNMGVAVSSTREAGTAQAPMLLLPALNAMFDITTTRTEAARVHPPLMIFGMLGALTLACSLFAGRSEEH